MKRLLLVPLVLCTLVLGAPPAVAGPPEEAAGDWTYVPAPLSVRTAGTNTFISATEVSTFTGTFVGTSDDEFVVVCHQKGPESFMNFVKGTVEFTGEVDGRAGDMTMKFRGTQDSTTCAPSGAIWYGTWVIIGGTDDLADLHGHGEWSGPSFDLDYKGYVHFD